MKHLIVKNVALFLHNNNSVKFTKGFFATVLSANMAALTSGAIKDLEWRGRSRDRISALRKFLSITFQVVHVGGC